jgi:transmembrane sensor
MVDQEEFLRKIIQYLNDQQNDALAAEVKQLTDGSAHYHQIYQQILHIWNASSGLQKQDQIDEDIAVLELEAKLAELQQHSEVVPLYPQFNLKRWIAVAAVLLIGVIAFLKYNQKPETIYLVKTTQSTVDSVKLADGSKIYLDAFSELKYPSTFTGDLRKIILLKGQAFFKIHRDTLRPFVVEIRNSRVTVLGTSFNIDSHGSQIALSVSTGKVKFQPLADKNDGSILHAGTGIVYDEVTGQELIVNSPDHNNQYWLTHEIDFNDASLVEVCKQLEECYKIKITLSNNTSAFKKFNAHFKDNKLTDVLEVLRDTYPIKVKHLDSGDIIIQSVAKTSSH